MPAWWTVFHDFCLLHGVLISGYKEYKLISELAFQLRIANVPSVQADGANSSETSLLEFNLTLNGPYQGFSTPSKEPGLIYICYDL